MQARDAPEKYWDFAVELATEYLNHIATRKLGWKTPHEYHFGDTPDISVFHFLFFEEIYYLEPNASFPKPNMLPGRFLGIARTTGDAFTFYILTKTEKGRDVILTHSMVRMHHQDAPQTFAEYPDQEERAEEMTVVQVDQPRLPSGTELQGQQEKDEPGSLVSMLIEVQPDGSRKILKGDDMMYQQVIK